jgi:hypothetical protein
MKQSDIDERVKELTTEAEMLGKQKRMLELLEECSKYGYEVELVDWSLEQISLFDGPSYVTLRCKRSGVWCTVGNTEGSEWEPSTWYFPDGIFGDGHVKVSDIWEGIEPPAPQLKGESLSSGQQTLDEYTDTKVESEKTESGAYRVSWGGLGKKEAKE